MAELLLELFSEEIPARMQAGAARALEAGLTEALAALAPQIETFYGPRRIAAVVALAGEVPSVQRVERGPRVTAPEAALSGFLRKHGAARDQLAAEGEYWVLRIANPARPAAALVADVVPGILRRFPWPKSMRWGGTSAFTWVRPLRRILCLLDGVVVPFDLREGADDGHGLASGALTEGHRFLAPGPVAAESAASWRAVLRARRVIVDVAERRASIEAGIADLAASRGLSVVADAGLLEEVAGLVEWPVPLLGRIDDSFMDLPPEVLQVSMRVNQRYFALRNAAGKAAPWFAFVANIEAADGGAAIIAGNERVLRARFSDARHFWDLDRKVTLESRVAALGAITFHAKLGTQLDRARRISRLAAFIAPLLGENSTDEQEAARAGLLAKADLTTGMVGEFPELQGVIGRHYAFNDRESLEICRAMEEHYFPKGPLDLMPGRGTPEAVALADKIDTLVGFFGIDETPTGSSDPFALRRAALGIVKIIYRHKRRLCLRPIISFACLPFDMQPNVEKVVSFIIDRLHVMLRSEGARPDVLSAAITTASGDDIYELTLRLHVLSTYVHTEAGQQQIQDYRRAANILKIEELRDGPYSGNVDETRLLDPSELKLYGVVSAVHDKIKTLGYLNLLEYENALQMLTRLREPLSEFFASVRVNDISRELRANRLHLLARVVQCMNLAADFSKIEG